MRAGPVAAALAGAVAISMAPIGPPAMASSLALTYFSCRSNSSRTFDCYVYYDGGTAPYYADWTGAHVFFTDETANEAHGDCLPGNVQVQVDVTDSAGGYLSRDILFQCLS